MNRRERKAAGYLAITLRPVKKKGESKCKDQVPIARVLAIALDESASLSWWYKFQWPGRYHDAQARLDDAIGDYETAENKRAEQGMAKIGTTHTGMLARSTCPECSEFAPGHSTGCSRSYFPTAGFTPPSVPKSKATTSENTPAT